MLIRIIAACWLVALAAGCGELPPADAPAPLVEIEPSLPGESLVDDEPDPAEARPWIPINADSLRHFMGERFSDQVSAGGLTLDYGDDSLGELISELNILGITTIAQLEEIIPPGFDQKAAHEFAMNSNVVGLVRTMMMVHEPERYFREAWKEHWTASSICDFHTMRLYGIDLERIRFSGVLRHIDITAPCDVD